MWSGTTLIATKMHSVVQDYRSLTSSIVCDGLRRSCNRNIPFSFLSPLLHNQQSRIIHHRHFHYNALSPGEGADGERNPPYFASRMLLERPADNTNTDMKKGIYLR